MIALPIEQDGLLVQAGVGVTSGLLPMAMHSIYTDLQPLGFSNKLSPLPLMAAVRTLGTSNFKECLLVKSHRIQRLLTFWILKVLWMHCLI